jgi:hypothetical protein
MSETLAPPKAKLFVKKISAPFAGQACRSKENAIVLSVAFKAVHGG